MRRSASGGSTGAAQGRLVLPQAQLVYSQPGLLFRLMTAEQKKVLFENTARAMGDAPREIKVRHLGNCAKADPAYGEGVARALGISMSEVPRNK